MGIEVKSNAWLLVTEAAGHGRNILFRRNQERGRGVLEIMKLDIWESDNIVSRLQGV